MMEMFNNKTQRVNVTQYDPNYLLSTKKTGGQREEGHGVVHHIQGEYHQTYLLQTPLSKCRHPVWTNSVQDEPMNQSSFFFHFLFGGGPLICQALSPNP